MSNSIKCLLIGYGNIGRIHSKYLDIHHNIEWFWHDPFIKDATNNNHHRILSLSDIDLNSFDKVFILTPEDSHYKIYRDIRKKFTKDIFVEKPGIVHIDEIDMLEDPRLTIGLVERYNPAIQTLINNLDIDKIINIDFSRCCSANSSSATAVLKDIGIHDIDLYFYLLNNKPGEINNLIISVNNHTILLHLESEKIISRFIWSKDTFFKERKIVVRQTDCTYFVDLQEQSVNRYFNNQYNQTISESLFVEKSSPIYNEQKQFLSNNPQYITAKESHKLLLKLLHND
jgi:hypothetical protein